MSAPPYMRLYWGDYHRDTNHLTRAQHGSYMLLLSALWNNGGKIAANDESLARVALCSAKEWAKDRPVLIAFFTVSRGRLTHKRLTVELAKYESTIGKRKEAGKRGSDVRHGKNKASGAANAKQLPTYPEPEPEGKNMLQESNVLTFTGEPPKARLDGALGSRLIEAIEAVEEISFEKPIRPPLEERQRIAAEILESIGRGKRRGAE